MKRSPRRKRAHLKAWVYLAIFGVDDVDEDGGATDSDSTAHTESAEEGNR